MTANEARAQIEAQNKRDIDSMEANPAIVLNEAMTHLQTAVNNRQRGMLFDNQRFNRVYETGLHPFTNHTLPPSMAKVVEHFESNGFKVSVNWTAKGPMIMITW
jgi:hypothetical protein